ncbi:xanthine dehydrogenase accessory factor [Amycolatopsis xylanica]|uniref:Xanthine dehydrogenase accessory factor n=1 Tax=Amycolatopsis xylanica TaxID=589385 RepID=A0A1H2UIL9_9PSEU|nr:XdhC family protein [Amycolatopsis xylanica]SDW55915.1 xanthine dehydrogenase accessory factor [Amycolatopsis xylanica]
MRDIAEELRGWDEPFAVATVVAVRGSAPREVGASMAVRADGSVIGSVSGGCVEGAVYELAQQVLATGVPVRTEFGFSADDPFAVGLTCGGSLDVFVQRADPAIRAALVSEEPVALVRVLGDGPSAAVFAERHVGDASFVDEARSMLSSGATGIVRLGSLEVFIESWVAPPTMLIFGAIDFAAALSSVGRFLGYHVVVCDARPTFATPARFPDADEVVVDWPHRYLARTATDARTVICVLTHDPKFDIPVLTDALRRDVAYVGALGSRRTHTDRLHRLRAEGLIPAELTRLRSPIGLDLGARTPPETAISIAAELIALHRGGTTTPLSTSTGPIHHDEARKWLSSGLI